MRVPKDHSGALPRRKSCAACIKAKRRCDQRMPACSRCTTRRISCTYSSPSVSQARGISTISPTPDLTFEEDVGESSGLTHAISTAHTPTTLATTSPLPNSSQWDPGLPDLDVFDIENLLHNNEYRVDANIQNMAFLNSSPLFSLPSLSFACRWAVAGYPPGPGEMASLPDDIHEYALNRLKTYPRAFVRSGGNSFISPQLYDGALPQPLLNAFCACTTYYARSGPTTRISFQVLDCIASALASPRTSWTIAEHLASLQALMLLQIIRLFDGDVRQRAVAEEHETIMKQWTSQLHLRFENEVSDDLGDHSQVIPSEPSWRAWLFSESVRRTLIVSHLLQGVYSVSKTGKCCSQGEIDSIKFTAASSLWGARSSWHWLRAWRSQRHWDVVMMDFDLILQDAIRSELDDFAMLMLATYRGLDTARDFMTKKVEGSVPAVTS